MHKYKNKMKDAIFMLLTLLLTSCVYESPARRADPWILQNEDTIIDAECEYMVVLGDVQDYTLSDETIYPLQTSLCWTISQRKAYGNIKAVIEVGDATWNNIPEQWDLYTKTIEHLKSDSIPVFTCTGNHDYDYSDGIKIPDRGSSLINTYMSDFFPENLIKARFEKDRVENIVVHLPLKKIDIDLIILEFGARTEAVKWAAEWVHSHPEQKYIFMTHEMLAGNNGQLIVQNSYAEKHFSETTSTWSSPKDILEKLLIPNPNIILTLCGHNGFAGLNEEYTNIIGRTIPIILFNLQYQINGGDSMLLLLEFNKTSNMITHIVYHTDMRTQIITNISNYIIKLD